MKIDLAGDTAYVYTGTPTLPATGNTVIFIHGAQNDHTVWGLQSRYLAHHGYRVLAVDLPGHGRSTGPALSTIDEIANWVIQIMDATDTQTASIVGHSMGSLAALATAGLAPDRVNALALVGSACPMRVSDVLLDAAANDEDKAIEMIANWSYSGVNHQPGSPGPGFSVYMGGVRLMQHQAKGVLLNDKCPVLLVSGAQDMMTPPKAIKPLLTHLEASESCPAVSQIVLQPCGHSIMSEQPDALLSALRKLIP
jgi:pimeloyl-ACP methyl ester carboxylesterase